jgi:hypothetical protein
MSTFLQLTNRLKLECGGTGSDVNDVVGLPAELNRLVIWINAAWMDIQTAREDWEWMRASTSFQTVAGKAIYTPTECGATNFGSWYPETFRNYDTVAGQHSELFMHVREYESWLDLWQYSSNRVAQTRPLEVAVTPNKSIGLGPTPNGDYTVTGDYFKVASEMVSKDDKPAMPPQFHIAIVYRAMMSYGGYEGAGEVYQRGELEFKKYMRRLSLSQLPTTMMPGALA